VVLWGALIGSTIAALPVLGACGAEPDDPRGIEYTVSSPGPIMPYAEEPCLSRLRPGMDGIAASEANWTVGAKLIVSWSWDRPCGGWYSNDGCDPLSGERVALASGNAWVMLDEPWYGPSTLLLEAVAPGNATIEAHANGRQFHSLVLRAVTPATLVPTVFEEPEGTPRSDVDRLDLSPSNAKEIALILRNAAGAEMCGSAPLQISLDAPLAAITSPDTDGIAQTASRLTVLAGAEPGSTRATFQAQDLTTTLDIQIAAP
jgi:hypothetical protein